MTEDTSYNGKENKAFWCFRKTYVLEGGIANRTCFLLYFHLHL